MAPYLPGVTAWVDRDEKRQRTEDEGDQRKKRTYHDFVKD
jgi:hypothetical protein